MTIYQTDAKTFVIVEPKTSKWRRLLAKEVDSPWTSAVLEQLFGYIASTHFLDRWDGKRIRYSRSAIIHSSLQTEQMTGRISSASNDFGGLYAGFVVHLSTTDNPTAAAKQHNDVRLFEPCVFYVFWGKQVTDLQIKNCIPWTNVVTSNSKDCPLCYHEILTGDTQFEIQSVGTDLMANFIIEP